jgi:glucose-1-phosphate adenylyltransferase
MVAVFGADHIYRMDVRQMVDFHKATHAHACVAAIPVPLDSARDFGIIDAAADGRITGFLEKPANPPPMPGDPTRAYGSMGNYLFDTNVLVDALLEAKRRGETDFGTHILPRLIENHRVHAYNFATNRIPGIRAYEEHAYWRDVGTLDAYYAANQDVLGAEPRFNLFNPQWFINSSNYQGPSPRIVSGQIEDSVVGAGSLINGARLKNTILRREVIVEPGVEIEDSIIMDYAVIRRGTRLRRVIVDRYNEIAPGTTIGFDAVADRARFTVSAGGVVVLPKGSSRPDITRYAI